MNSFFSASKIIWIWVMRSTIFISNRLNCKYRYLFNFFLIFRISISYTKLTILCFIVFKNYCKKFLFEMMEWKEKKEKHCRVHIWVGVRKFKGICWRSERRDCESKRWTTEWTFKSLRFWNSFADWMSSIIWHWNSMILKL